MTSTKSLLTLVAFVGLSSVALADIHDPPMNDQGPTRKLGRGVANLLFSFSEVPQTLNEINNREGNAAAWTYGVSRGFGRWFFRMGVGLYEIVLHPFPTMQGSYKPPYKLDPPWLHGGYEEFPPELGFESRFEYIRDYGTGFQ